MIRPLHISLDAETFEALEMLAFRFGMSPPEMIRRLATTLATSARQMHLHTSRIAE